MRRYKWQLQGVFILEWLRRILNRAEQSQKSTYRARILAHEVWDAHQDWKVAELKLNEAIEPDQIDYAIYIVEAAEKRFNMLLREAREQQLDMSEYGFELPEPRKNMLDM
jgi:hypothetical protein